MTDLFDNLVENMGALGEYSEVADGYFMFPKLEGEVGTRMKFNGKEVLNWSLNNYLGLANHPEVRKADENAACKWGIAYPMGSRIMTGDSSLHVELENQLANFVGKEAVMVLNSGYQGMVSIVDTLVNPKDVVIYDSETHASTFDGVRLHRGRRLVFPHNDTEKLELRLRRAEKMTQETGGGILVITEGVYGMSGNMAKLREITALKKRFNFRLFVDDAHGFGTMGETGAGTGEALGVQDGIDLYFSTFTKAMAGLGAFIAGEKRIINYLRFNTRSQVFSRSLPAIVISGVLKRLEIARKHPEFKENLWKITQYLQSELKKNGFDIGTTESCITPVFLSGTLEEACNLVTDLRENYNIFFTMVIYPVVPKGVIQLRLTPTASHTFADVDETIQALNCVKVLFDDGFYKKEEFVHF